MGRALGRILPCVRIPNACHIHGGTAGLLGAALIGLALLLVSPIGAQAQTLAALPLPTKGLVNGGRAEPLRAWMQLCREMPGECGVDPSEKAVIALTPEVWQALVLVNREVNERIKAVTDRDHWGVEDRWNLPDDGYGDCEDIQLLKRKMLIELGLPRRAMRMTVVIDEEGGGHAVMMVRTDRGDLILDNRRPGILPWTQTGYVYIKAEGQDGLEWMSLGGATAPIVTAHNDDRPPSVSSGRVASR
jgi:predicted transglutaminase-like cysteine proteinase